MITYICSDKLLVATQLLLLKYIIQCLCYEVSVSLRSNDMLVFFGLSSYEVVIRGKQLTALHIMTTKSLLVKDVVAGLKTPPPASQHHVFYIEQFITSGCIMVT